MGKLPLTDDPYVCCCKCFADPGMRYSANQAGTTDPSKCLRCGTIGSRKLTRGILVEVALGFFVKGSFERFDFGAAPMLEINETNSGDEFSGAIGHDAEILRQITDLRVFHYGPNLWMLGHIEPLEDLQDQSRRRIIIARILEEYPTKILREGSELYRLRVNPDKPNDEKQYDSPPANKQGHGRFCRVGKPIMYASQDLETCIHEVRAAVDDRLYVATLRCETDLRLLDLTAIPTEQVTDFESLDLAVLFTFLAGEHAYKITRAIADAVEEAGFDGVVYPSYFSRLRSGAETVGTVFGMSARRHTLWQEQENRKVVRNLALFGRPLKRRKLSALGINSVMLERVEYHINLGPVGF
ncbi:RES domain superfamily [Ahrensia sp. R2A130]|nr:RES domain superfamily [Ahrensia sp. R2A130]